MRRPLLLYACTKEQPDDGGFQRWLCHAFHTEGFSVALAFKHNPARNIRAYCGATGRRPDVLVFAPEFGMVTMGSNMRFAETVIDEVRSLPDDLCFPGHVRAKTIPIVLAAYGANEVFHHSWKHRDLPQKWCRTVRDHDDNEGPLRAEVREAIRDWRHDLLTELEYIGYAITRDAGGRFQVAHATVRRAREGRILAEDASPHGLRSAGYYILKTDVLDDVPAFKELEGLLSCFRHVAAMQRVQPEAVLQEFFERNPHMMLRGEFDDLIPKMQIPRADGRGAWEPDFAHAPRPKSASGWAITDLKLPSEAVLTGSRLHRQFSRAVNGAIAQLLDYEHALATADERARDYLMRRYGCVPQSPRLAVIIGRRPTKPDDYAALQHRLETYRPLRVQVVGYDDILEDEEDRILLQFSLGVE